MTTARIGCPRCGASLPADAAFCDGCGARLGGAPGANPPHGASQPAARSMAHAAHALTAESGEPTCVACGALAPTTRHDCALCGAPFANPRVRAPKPPEGTAWVRLSCEVTCRQCGARSPVDAPELDGTISCSRCGVLQAFDLGAWRDAFAHAHAVADLAGPDPEGRLRIGASIAPQNPFATIGVDRTSATLELSGMTIEGGVLKTRNLAVEAAPGHPRCAACRGPLATRVEGGRLATRCKGCGAEAHYRAPAALAELALNAVAFLSDAFRDDRPDARLEKTSAGQVVSLRCPGCGAGLSPEAGARLVECTFCKASCRVPSRTLLALRERSGAPSPFWVLFSGPSAQRAALVSGAGAAEHNTEHRDDAPSVAPRTGDGLEPPPGEVDRAVALTQIALQVALPLLALLLVSAFFVGKLLATSAPDSTATSAGTSPPSFSGAPQP